MSKTRDREKVVHQQKLQFGSERIPCEVIFDNRDHLKIKVYPDMRVVIHAPLTKSMSQVLDNVKKRTAWILRQRNYFEQFIPRQPERRYVSGESLYYLGRQYRLKVIQSDTESAKLIGRFLYVYAAKKTNTDRVRSLLQKWYQQHAIEIFQRRLEVCHESAKRYGIPRPAIKLRLMQRRWGSYNGSQHILLNTQLVKAPLRCIDYVIIHELCHLKYPTHSDNFYRLLIRLLPDWKERKERLEHVML